MTHLAPSCDAYRRMSGVAFVLAHQLAARIEDPTGGQMLCHPTPLPESGETTDEEMGAALVEQLHGASGLLMRHLETFGIEVRQVMCVLQMTAARVMAQTLSELDARRAWEAWSSESGTWPVFERSFEIEREAMKEERKDGAS